jgi:DNA polymerase (family 10)
MTNAQIAAALAEIGTLLELRGENPFRTRAYQTAARAIDQLGDSVAARVRTGELGDIPGIGDATRQKIKSLVLTGSIPQLEELRAATPPGLIQMLRLPGLGPKKVIALSEAGINDLATLKQAAESGRLARLAGFGGKTAEKILQGMTFIESAGTRIRLDTADRLANPILEAIRAVKGVKRAEAGGSIRRRKETIGDLDFLAAAADPGPVMDAFARLPSVGQVVVRGDTLTSVMLPLKSGGEIRADLRVVQDAVFPFALHHFSGSKEHNIAMRGRAQDRGFKVNEYGLHGPKGDVPCNTEADFFTALGLEYIPPELRENAGEIAAAEAGTLPELIEVGDVRGVFHNHTTASDGSGSLEEMAAAAKALGLSYLGIADHSQSLTVARGLTPDRVRQQQAEIDALNKKMRGFRIFKGTECDILPDGRLDFADDVLATFDYVVASVHTHFSQSREEMTARVVRAVRHPMVTMLGHPTGRLLLKREGFAVDLDAVLAAAAESGTMLEINAQPTRLDLDGVHARRAKELGVLLVINPDAHSTAELALYRYGVDVARRGWLTAKDVANTRTAGQVEKLLTAKLR